MPLDLPTATKQFLLKTIGDVLGDEPYEVYLFGSYAAGKANGQSDIDLALKGAKPLDLAKWAKIEAALEESGITQRVDVVDFRRVSTDFQTIIAMSGICWKR